jgi:hypothetical protein
MSLYQDANCFSRQEDQGFQLKVVNPAIDGKLTLIGDIPYQQMNYSILSSDGRECSSGLFDKTRGTVEIDLPTFSGGLYYFRLWQGDYSENHKVVLIR